MTYRKDYFNKIEFKKTDNGYLSISGIVTRTGVFDYVTHKELRSEEEVLKQKSLDSMFAVPVTWEHPPDLLTPSSTAEFMKGFVAGRPEVIEKDNEKMIKLDNIIVTDPALIYEIENRNVDKFSAGYDCNVLDSKGEHGVEKYDSIQTDIVYNHIAFVKSPRCGDACSITHERKDSIMPCECGSNKKIKKDEEGKEEEMSKKDKEEKEVEKKDEEAPEWAKTMLSQHKEMLEVLRSLMKGEKEEKEAEEKEDEESEETEEEKKEKVKEKTKKSDSVYRDDSISYGMKSFLYNHKEEKTERLDSVKNYAPLSYNRQDFINSMNKKG